MLLDFIARYYTFFWLGLAAVAFLKIILSNIFHGNLEGVNGIVYALFKWYSEDEQEMEDVRRRRLMRVHNLITIFVYFMILVVVFASILPSIFSH